VVTDTQKSDDISYLFYFWLIPVVVGIPGNVMAIIVANRKHNRRLSPCIYMTAMGVADTVLLMERAMAVVLNKVLLDYGIVTDPLWWFK
jgi:threonine/homoserine/homoserine lactone efflux protein